MTSIKPHLESISEELLDFIDECPHELWRLRRALVKLRGEVLSTIDVCNAEALTDRLVAMSKGQVQ